MSNYSLEPAYDPALKPENPGRRKMLIASASAVSAVGAAYVAVPFLSSWLPSERAKAVGAPVVVDISKLAAGALQTVLWQGKVVYILRRTPEMVESLSEVTNSLRDPDSLESVQPEYATNSYRSVREDVMVMLGVCTHLGCAPMLQSKEQGREARGDMSWVGGFFCPCHGSSFDYAGRVFKGVPAPLNLPIPPYHFSSDDVVVVGEEASNG